MQLYTAWADLVYDNFAPHEQLIGGILPSDVVDGEEHEELLRVPREFVAYIGIELHHQASLRALACLCMLPGGCAALNPLCMHYYRQP